MEGYLLVDDELCVRSAKQKSGSGDSDTDSDADSDADTQRDTNTDYYHPAGYAGAAVHGPETNLQVEDCRPCHGEQLKDVDIDEDGDVDARDGDCDVCHLPDWRTTCTYCHGGTENNTGAPPREIDRSDDPSTFSFQVHGPHVTETEKKAAFDCDQCHQKPTDIMTPGHIIVGDPSGERSEVDFSGGIGALTIWSGGTCSNNYCHGDGQVSPGSVSETDSSLDCNSCHMGPGASADDLMQMSGAHGLHIEDPEISGECAFCHGTVVSSGETIGGKSLHVNGSKDISFTQTGVGMTWDGVSCIGACHEIAETWWLGGAPPSSPSGGTTP